jgi:quinoprotein glucose dehydrogenase
MRLIERLLLLASSSLHLMRPIVTLFCLLLTTHLWAADAAHGDGKKAGVDFPGVDLELKREDFAKPPQVQHPIALDVDPQGRVFVAETYRYEKRGIVDNRGKPVRELADLQITSLEERERTSRTWLDNGEMDADMAARVASYSDPGDGKKNFLTKFSEKVACLVDTNHDLKADERTDFVTGYNGLLDGPAAGVMAWRGKVWLTCVPDLWLLEDKDKDNVADQKQSLVRGFGVRHGWFGHDLHGLAMGPDGRIYFSVGDRGFNVKTKEGRTLFGPRTGAVFRCWPDGKELEVVARGLRNPQELAFDDFGNLFTGDNNCDAGDKARIEYVVDGADYGWEVSYQDLVHRGPWLREKMWELRPDKNDASYPAWILPPVGHLSAGPSGLAAYPGTGLPAAFNGHLFLCDFRGGGNGYIFSFQPQADGAGFKLGDTKIFESGVGVSDLAFGYDGRIYVSDWGNAWDQNDASRVYTITHEPSQKLPLVAEVQQLAASNWEERSVEDLAKLLSHKDRRIRYLAQQTLAGKAVPEVLEKVLPLARKQESQLGRIHALWTLEMMARIHPVLLTELTPFLQDEDAEIRAQAARLLGEARHLPSVPQLISLLGEPSLRVRMLSGMALGRLGDGSAVMPLLQMARENDDRDPLVRHGVVMGLAGCAKAGEIVSRTQASPSKAVRLAAVLALRRLEAPEIERFLLDTDPQIVTEAARAIYDKQITSAFPTLAAALDRTEWPEALRGEGFLRRSIEMNLRLGGATEAERVVKFATLPKESGVPETFRLIALDALNRWDQPEQREQVWGRWAPLPARAAGLARASIKSLLPEFLKTAEGDVLNKAREVENRFGAEKTTDQLLALVKDQSFALNLRLDFLKTLEARGNGATAQTEEVCRSLLANLDAPPRLRVEARALLVKHQPGSALATYSDALITGSTLEKQEAVLSIAKIRSNDTDRKIQELGNALVAGTLDPVIQVEVLEALRHRDEKRSVWRRILDHYEEKLDHGGDALAAHRVMLQGGDAATGQAVFHNHQSAQCLRCHAIGGHGGIVGPELNGVAARGDATFLLESLVMPSAKVADGYGIVGVTLKDDKVLGGILQSKTKDGITLLEGTTARVIPQAEIKEISAPMSGMPPMAALLTQRELRDLLAYLATLK